MAQIKDVNNPTTIIFTLTSSQTGAATLRVGTTLSFAGGRPQVTVNGWVGPAPDAPVNVSPTATFIKNLRRICLLARLAWIHSGNVPRHKHSLYR